MALDLPTREQAEEIHQRFCATLRGFNDHIDLLGNIIHEVKQTEVWKVLGSPSWQAYVAETVKGEIPPIHATVRDALIEFLTNEGMSRRAVAESLGIGTTTVQDVVDAKKGKGRGGATKGVQQVRRPVDQLIRLLQKLRSDIDSTDVAELARLAPELACTTAVIDNKMKLRVERPA